MRDDRSRGLKGEDEIEAVEFAPIDEHTRELKRRCEEMIAELRELQRKYVRAEARYFLELERFEQQQEVWRVYGDGMINFESFLVAADLGNISRYSTFKAALARFGPADITMFGIDQMRFVAKISPDVLVPAGVFAGRPVMDVLLEDLRKRATAGGPVVEESSLRSRANRLGWNPNPRTRVPSDVGKLKRDLLRAREKIATLESELAGRDKTIARLRKQIERWGGKPVTSTARDKKS